VCSLNSYHLQSLSFYEEPELATQDTTDIFAAILARAIKLDPANTRKWFSELKAPRFSGGLLEVGCPDEAKRRFLKDNCKASFTRAAQQVTGHLVSVSFYTEGRKKHSRNPSGAEAEIKIHPDYTFENFVVGPGNRLAQASCVAVSHSPGDTYNPLFVYGNVGLGKTHLLHAICYEAQQESKIRSIQFLSCEEFINRFINAIEQARLSEFQSQFRTVDMLVIDDVQFLRDHEQSQEEFFHTFNALYNNRKQIILSADSAPGQIPSLEDRLISRFKWGLVARIDPPSYETRVAIVKKKAYLRGLSLPEEVAEYIAHTVRSNIRELEGALTLIQAEAIASGQDITAELARKAMGDQAVRAERQTSITEIIDVVTQYYDVRLADMQSKKRNQSIAMPRQICMYLARNLTRHSLEEIGGHLGGRDHTTVMHACSKIVELENTDPQIRSQLTELTRQIQKT
jgi:chromosomal replication initiator protein